MHFKTGITIDSAERALTIILVIFGLFWTRVKEVEEFPTSHHLSGAVARFLKKISRLNEISLDFIERCLTPA